VDIQRKRVWSGQRILAAIAVIPWAYLLWIGYEFCYGPRVQHMPVVPNRSQIHLYVVTPAVGFAISLALLFVANKLPLWIEVILFIIQLVALVPVLGMWGGGV
jgi:hypothetical protein